MQEILVVLAIVMQSLDAYTSCQNINHGFGELNPLNGKTCKSVVISKSVMLSTLVIPKTRGMISVGLITAGSIGVTLNIAVR